MNEPKRSFELTSAFILGSFIGKLIVARSILCGFDLKDSDKRVLEIQIASTSDRKEFHQWIVKNKTPEFWEELKNLECFENDMSCLNELESMAKEEKA